MDNSILVNLSAQDNLSPVLEKVGHAFDEIKKKYEEARDEMAATGGVVASFQAIERATASATSSVIAAFNKIGEEGAALATALLAQEERLAAERDRMADREIQEASRRDAERLAQIERVLEMEKNLRARAFEQRMAAERKAAQEQLDYEMDLADRKARAIHNIRERERQQIEEGQRLVSEYGRDPQRGQAEQAVIKQIAAEEELARNRVHWLDQYEQHKRQFALADLEAIRIQERGVRELNEARIQGMNKAENELARFDEKVSAFHDKAARGARTWGAALTDAMTQLGHGPGPMTGALQAIGGMSGSGGLGGLIGSAAGGLAAVTGPVGMVASLGGSILGPIFNTLMSGIGAVAGAVTNFATGVITFIPKQFMNIAGAINESVSAMGEFVKQGLALVGVYQVINGIEDAIQGLNHALVDFQFRFTQIEALTVRENENFGHLRESILDASMATGRSASELARAMFFIESHGFQGNEAERIMDRVSKMAAAGLGESDDLVRIVAGQLQEYGLHGQAQIDRLFDIYTQTERVGSIPPGELAGQVQRLTPIAAAMGIEPEQIGGLIATVTQSGLGASRVITDIVSMMQSLIDATPKAQQALAAMGLTIADVRKAAETPGPQGGFFAALNLIYEKSGGNQDLLAQVFGDGTRAMVGFFSAFKNGGVDYQRNLELMYKSTGALDTVWGKMEMTLQVQMQRMRAILEAGAIALAETIVPAVSGWLKGINDAFQQGDITTGLQTIIDGFTQAADAILSTVADLAGKMFGAGGTLIVELANGMMAAAQQTLFYASNFVADLIAGFLLGSSPPERGPLHYITQGVMAWNKEYATAMLEGGMMLGGTAEHVAGVVNEQLAKIGDVQAAGTRKGIEAQIANIDRQLLPWQLATDQIKESYNEMLRPLEQQMDIINNIKDLEYGRKQLVFERQEMELAELKIRAEGDPAKRAALVGQLERQRLIGEGLGIDKRLAELRRRQGELGKSKMSPAERALEARIIANDIAELEIQKKIFQLKDQGAAVAYASGKEALDAAEAAAKLEHDAFEQQKKEALQPIKEEHDKIEAKMKSELDYITKQTDGLNDQKKILQTMLKMLPPDKAGGGAGAAAGGGGWQKQASDQVKEWEKQLRIKADELVQTYKDKLLTGFNNFINSPLFTQIGLTIAGAIGGGLIAGLPGAITGAQLVPMIANELKKRGVTGGDFVNFATEVKTAVKDAFATMQPFLEAGDIFGAVASLQPTVKKWTDDFWKMMFAEFATIPVDAGVVNETAQGYQTAIEKQFQQVPVGTEGSSRYTGLGRSIIELLFGKQDANLNQEIAAKMINDKIITPVRKAVSLAVVDLFNRFTHGGLISDEEGSGQGYQTTEAPATTLARNITNALVGAFNIATSAITSEELKGFRTLGGMIGGQIVEGIKDEMEKSGQLGKMLAGRNPVANALGTFFFQGPIGAAGLAADTAGPPIGRAVGGAADTVGGAVAGIPTPSLSDEHGPGALIEWAKGVATSLTGYFSSDKGKAETGKVGESITGGVTEGMDNSVSNSLIDIGTRTLANKVEQGLKDEFIIASPAGLIVPIGEAVVEGFNKGIVDTGMLTGPIITTWVTNEVINQARLVLLGGEGGVGGMEAIGKDARAALGRPFEGGLPGDMRSYLNTFGNQFVDAVMDPIEGGNGILARINRVLAAARAAIASAPKPPAEAPAAPPATSPDLPPPPMGDPAREDQSVRGATSYALAYPETSSSNDININAPLIQVASMSTGEQGASELDPMLDRVRDFLVNDIRTARGQGVSRPAGVTARGAR